MVEENGECSFVGEPFEACGTATDVHALASRIQSIVQEVCEHVPKIEVAFSSVVQLSKALMVGHGGTTSWR